VPLVEPARYSILGTNGKVQVAATWHHDFIEESVEDMPPGPVALLAVDDLMEHDGLGRNLEIADRGALLVLLKRDDHTVFIHALFCFDATTEGILADMWKDVASSGEVAVDNAQL
jgi:hypothetical protein